MRWLTLGLLVGVLFLGGCGDSAATSSIADKIDQIKVGMTLEEVEAILGPTTTTVEGLDHEMRWWGEMNTPRIVTVFRDGKLAEKDVEKTTFK